MSTHRLGSTAQLPHGLTPNTAAPGQAIGSVLRTASAPLDRSASFAGSGPTPEHHRSLPTLPLRQHLQQHLHQAQASHSSGLSAAAAGDPRPAPGDMPGTPARGVALQGGSGLASLVHEVPRLQGRQPAALHPPVPAAPAGRSRNAVAVEVHTVSSLAVSAVYSGEVLRSLTGHTVTAPLLSCSASPRWMRLLLCKPRGAPS